MTKKILLVGGLLGLAVIAYVIISFYISNEYQVGIRGTVTSLTGYDDSITMLVEGQKEKDTSYDYASVKVDNKTIIKRKMANGKYKSNLKYADIKIGDKVEVVFDGAVAESYPVQGTAKRVTIILDKE